MNYVSWAALFEGAFDRAYFSVLLPRAIEWLALREGRAAADVAQVPIELSRRRDVETFATEACRASDAFHICFVHADTGGRALEYGLATRTNAYCEAMNRLCGWPFRRCVIIAPRKETEAWALADPEAVISALGLKGAARRLGLPPSAREAEALRDPKASFEAILEAAGLNRRAHGINAIATQIALRQEIEALTASDSFAAFVQRLRVALTDLQIIG
jgi:hypothetical protein